MYQGGCERALSVADLRPLPCAFGLPLYRWRANLTLDNPPAVPNTIDGVFLGYSI